MSYKPLLKLLCALSLGVAALMSDTVAAEQSSLFNAGLDGLNEGSLLLTPIGQRGAGIRMLFKAAGQNSTSFFNIDNNHNLDRKDLASEVYISLVIPW